MNTTSGGRRLRAAAVLTAAALVAAACTSTPSDRSTSSTALTPAQIASAMATPTTITFWTWNDLSAEVKLFEQKYPAITVKMINAGQGSAEYTKLRSALTAGKGAPDVAQIEYQLLPTFTTTNDLLDLTPYGAASLQSQFIGWAWNQVTQNGKIFAVPQDTGPMGMLYRTDLLAKYHIAVPQTWAEFATAARQLHAADPGVYLANLPPNEPGAFTGLTWQAQSRPFTMKSSTDIGVTLNDSGARQVADFWTPLVKDGVVSTDPDFTDQWYQGLANGKYATWLTAAWGPLFLQGTAKDTAGKWRAAPLPQWSAGAQVSGNWGGSTSAVLKQSANKTAAAVFTQFLNSDPASTKMLATKQFLFPATQALLSDETFTKQQLAFYGGQAVNEVFAQISATVPTNFTWSPFQDFVYSSANDTLGKAITNRQDLTPSLASWQDAVVAYAKKQGFTVTSGG
jgi:multiple sugar transport system substrate-binding protein